MKINIFSFLFSFIDISKSLLFSVIIIEMFCYGIGMYAAITIYNFTFSILILYTYK